MIPAPNFQDIDKILNSDIWTEDGPVSRIKPETKVVGVVFFSNNKSIPAIEDFFRNIDLLHLHSAKKIHFLLAGVSRYGSNKHDVGEKICTIDEVDLYINTKAFNSFRIEVESKMPDWQFDYGLDLVLVNVRGEVPNRYLDFEKAIPFKIPSIDDSQPRTIQAHHVVQAVDAGSAAFGAQPLA